MKTYEGKLWAEGLRFGIVLSRFNSFITERLLEGALDCLKRHGCKEEDVEIFKVPGSFEIPLMAKKLAKGDKFDAVIALGAVIRGETPHFDYVAAEVSKGIALVSLETEKPIAFGILTTDTVDQAIDRAGAKAGNKGWEAALTAIEMVNLLREVEK
ncbi:MAG: 6,7-dimethyl-8-ribityllumazine synthase [Thermovibrio sp.]|nr:MAG: 6,7-dimethyl-8-ribityllumazine synthase [Thermovibrio sp.]